MDVPTPDLCHEEIWRLMMLHRNEKKLFHRECDSTGKPLISAYDKDTPFPVYSNEVWWGDTWSELDYGRDFDFDRAFFDQFKDLQSVVPREGTSVFSSENSEFNSHTRECRDCYLNTLAVRSRDTHYSYWAVDDTDVVDCLITNNSTLCYECIDCEHCYSCVLLQDCHHCTDCSFSYDLRNCENCIGCSGLRHKKNYLFNKPVSEKEFQDFKKKVLSGSHDNYLYGKEFLEKLKKESPHKDCQNTNCENATGNHLLDCKNCFECYDSHTTPKTARIAWH